MASIDSNTKGIIEDWEKRLYVMSFLWLAKDNLDQAIELAVRERESRKLILLFLCGAFFAHPTNISVSAIDMRGERERSS